MKNHLKITTMYKKRFSFFRLIIFLILLVIAYGAGLYSVKKSAYLDTLAEEEYTYVGEVINKYSPAVDKLDNQLDFDIFWDIYDELKDTYIDGKKLEDKKLIYGAMKGMVNSVGDPYTVFMEPKISKEFSDSLAGTFEGIGAEIGIKNELLTIIAPLPDMPAEKAGLMAGDIVLKIDGESTSGITIDEAVAKIRGKKGTEVLLSIAREGSDILDYSIRRGKIVVKSLNTEINEDNIFIISVSNFNDDTEALMNDAVREIVAKNPSGIILDLRNNPGGYLDTAIEMASEWVEDGTIVAERTHEEALSEDHLARGRARLKDFETVVLINRGSASASEIVSGALQDYDRALIVGEPSFGKGSVQTIANLADGSSLKITVAEWITPEGRNINEEGIKPDALVELSLADFQADKDPQMEAAFLLIKSNMDMTSILEYISTSTEDNLDGEK